MYTNHTHCRACDCKELMPVFDLGVQPLANDFRKDGESRAGYALLKVLLCPRCGLGQLSVVVDPAVLYSNYSYVTSPSVMMRDHFQTLVDDIMEETSGRSVLEIGCNDGLLLAIMKNLGFNVLGVDPAENLCAIARERGVNVQSGFFGEDLARVLPQSDIVIARHVFCHVDDWHDFVRGLEAVSHTETLICIEVPYAGDMLSKCEFDTVYHEHLSYLTLKSVTALLEGTSLQLYGLRRYPIHGGAVLLMLRHRDSKYQPIGDFTEAIEEQDWKAFAIKAHAQINRLRATVTSLVAQGKCVAGLGASAKSTVWISACGFTRKEIAFISDTTLQKQNTLSPGTDIPILDEGAIMRELPDYVILFAWNYASECLEKFKFARSKGVKFIIPVPTIEIC